MKSRLAFILFLAITSIEIAAQKQGNIWMFGEGGGLDFNSGIPVALSGSQVFGNPIQPLDYPYNEGCSSIADSSGNLLFYSNGGKVWDRNHQVMPNGDSLMGFYSSTSAALIVPVPLSDSLYYIFTTDGLERYLGRGLRYSIVNMCLNNGYGDIVESKKNIFMLDTASEKLCAIAHPNGTDIWLVAHRHFTNSFYSYLITPSGISAPVITNIGSVHTGNFSFFNGCGTAIGQMKASSNGNRIGIVFSNVMPAVAEVFDFNSSTGVLSNVISLLTNGNEYGIEFSPDNSKLYFSNVQGLYQFNLNAGNQAAINASKTQITNLGTAPCPIQLGPDGKIYVCRLTNYLGAVTSPNNLGLSCSYVNNFVSIGTVSMNVSLPIFIAGYSYANHSLPSCSVIGIEPTTPVYIMNIFPNPFSSHATISNENGFMDASMIIYNSIGQEIEITNHIYGKEINILRRNLSNGFYFVRICQDNEIIFSGKVMVEN